MATAQIQERKSVADINIVQEHTLTPQKAREAAQQVADKLAQEFDLAYQWEGDVLRFERSGVAGALTLDQHQARMSLKLGFLYSAFATVIQSKATEKMRKVFSGAQAA
jgi:putative polyhydroxyalkanoate system protein